MSDTLEKLQYQLEAAQRALTEAKACCAPHDAKHQTAIKELENAYKKIEQAYQADDVLRESKELLRSIVENAPVRIFWKDKDGRYLGCNTLFAKDAGYSHPDELIGKTDYEMAWKGQAELYITDDKTVMTLGNAKLDYEEPQTTPDGKTIWLSTSKMPLRDKSNRIIGMLGIYQDITERRQAIKELRESEAFTRAVLDNLPVGIAVNSVEPSVRFSYMNKNFSRFYRTTREKLNDPDIFWEAVYENTEFRQQIKQRVLEDCASGDIGRMNWENIPITRKGEETTYIDAKNIPVPGKSLLISMVWDVTERKKAEEALHRANRALKLRSECNMELVHADNEQVLLSEICRMAVETGGYMMTWVGYAEEDAAKTVRPVAQSGFEEGYLDGLNITWNDTKWGQGPTGTAIRTGVTDINQDSLANPKMAPWREAAIKRGYRSSIGLPLAYKKRVLGALTIYAAKPNAFVEEEVLLLEELASDLAFGIVTLRTRIEHEQQVIMMQQSLEQSIETIAATLEARDPYTAGHQQRVADLATAIAQEMGLPEEQIKGIHLAATIHDLGKIHIPAEILSKPGKLTDIEYMLIKEHPQSGYDIVKDVKFPWPIADIILQHHEKLDGSGYPQGLKEGQILLEAKILTVADVVEAMSSHRPYRPGLGIDNALAEIERNRGKQYDPTAVDACIKLFHERGYSLPV